MMCGIVLNISQPLKETATVTQARPKQVIATDRHTGDHHDIVSPWLIMAIVKSGALNMNTKPPQAKNLGRASVGVLVDRVESGGPNHGNKHVRQCITVNTASRLSPFSNFFPMDDGPVHHDKTPWVMGHTMLYNGYKSP